MQQASQRLFRGRNKAPATPSYASSAAFRAALLASSSRRRVVNLDGRTFRFTPTQRGGNCGFQAIAWALIIVGRGGPGVSSDWVREAAARAVRQERQYWARRVGDHEHALAPLGGDVQHDKDPPQQHHHEHDTDSERDYEDAVNTCFHDVEGTSVSHGDVSEESFTVPAPVHPSHDVTSPHYCVSPPVAICDNDVRSCITATSTASVTSAVSGSLVQSPSSSASASTDPPAMRAATVILDAPPTTGGVRESGMDGERGAQSSSEKRWLARVDAFAKSVVSSGIDGHWLGQCWGELEISVLARALDIHIELITFDARNQRPRSYHKDGDPSKLHVALLFTGSAEAGHFDLLQEDHHASRRKKPAKRH